MLNAVEPARIDRPQTPFVALHGAVALAAAGAAERLRALARHCLPQLPLVGGSAAQRELMEETLLLCLVNARDVGAAQGLLEKRLARRSSPLDRRRLRTISTLHEEPSELVS